jgi:hypothetical protein
MAKDLTLSGYNNYMAFLKSQIERMEYDQKHRRLERSKKVAQLTYEEWLKFIAGEIKI